MISHFNNKIKEYSRCRVWGWVLMDLEEELDRGGAGGGCGPRGVVVCT
jgi:hypothetical protein